MSQLAQPIPAWSSLDGPTLKTPALRAIAAEPIKNSLGFTIRDPRDAETVVLDASQEGASVAWFHSKGHSGKGTLIAAGGRAHLRTEDGSLITGEVLLEFTVYGIPMSVQCGAEEGQLTNPTSVSSAESRAATRVKPRELVEMEWYTVDETGVTSHRAPVVDIGTGGARTFHEAGAQVPVGTTFAATISAKNELVSCMAHVRSRTTTEAGTHLGLQLVAQDPRFLADIVLRTLFPEVRPRRDVAPGELYDLFEDSGYLRLREGCAPSSEWAAVNADELTRDLVYVGKSGDAIAHGSVTRAYRNTWLGHQTAMRSNHTEATRARRLLTTMTMITSLLEGPSGRLIAYYNPFLPYGRLFFDRFAKWVDSPELAVVTHLDWFEHDGLPLTLDVDVPPEISVGVATPRELAFVTDLARSQLPPLLSDALDLHPSLLRASALHPSYAASHLTRSREVFVVRSHGRPIGGALCELTSKELSLFNTLNLAQFFFVDGCKDVVAQRALHHHVRSYYEAHGIQDPFVLAPPGAFDPSLHNPKSPPKRTGCITWSFEGIRAYENYVRLRCAWLERGRRPRLKRQPAEATAPKLTSEAS